VPSGRAERDATFGWFWAVYFLLNFGQGVFPPLLPQVMDGLHLSFAAAGLLGTAFGLARLVTDVPAGMLIERRGAAGALHGGIACLLVGTALSALATTPAGMYLARGIVGAGSGLSIVVSILFLMRRGPAALRTRRGNLYEVAVIGGTATSAWLGGAVAARLGWRWGFGLAGLAIALGWSIAASRLAPAMRSLGPVAPGPAGAPRPRWTAIARAPVLSIYAAAFTLAVAWAGGIATFLPLLGGRGLGMSAEGLGRVLSVAYVIEASLLVPVGWLADTTGRVRILVPGFLVMLAGMLVVPHATGVMAFGVVATCLVLGMAVWMIPPVLLAEWLPGGFRGPAAGLYRFVADLGYILAPGVIGWLIGWRGFTAAAAAMAVLFAVAAVLSVAFLGRRPGPARLAPAPIGGDPS
jgi:MFS family permease